MDRRYIEIIANGLPYPTPRKLKNIIVVCLIALVPALGLMVSDNYVWYGFTLGMAASLGLIITGYFASKARRQEADKFLKQYDATGQLPPFPLSGMVKCESPQNNN